MELSPGKFRAQMARAEEALRRVATGLFGGNLPPDRLLNDFFRAHRCCGSRDRKIISAGVYALFRYWGWLRLLLDDPLCEQLEKGQDVLSRREWIALLCGALYLADEERESCEAMRRELGLPLFPAGNSPAERAGNFASALGIARKFPAEALLPKFVLSAMDGALPRENVLDALTRRPPMWLRVREERRGRVLEEWEKNGIRYRESPALRGAFAVEPSRVNLFTLESFRRGDFEVQDLASQAIGLVAGAAPGQRWFDACAGAGGKTLLLAETMRGRGSILAGDVRQHALDALRKRARRAGYSNISSKVHDGFAWRGRHPFDGVLIDAPCSGSGVWRRNAGCPWRFSPGDLERCVARQKEILDAFAAAVRCGGVLVYSTCSFFPEENAGQCKAFLERHPGFEPEDFPHPLTGEPTGGAMTVRGDLFDCDWMFAARFRRKA